MRKITYIKQPTNRTCGQTTIAMIAGINVQESIKLFGHDKSSYIRDYKRVLGQLGFKYSNPNKVDGRRKLNLPKMAIVRMQKVGRKTGHLFAYHNGVFYDPLYGIFNSREALLDRYNSTTRGRWRIDWYMEVSEDKVAGN